MGRAFGALFVLFICTPLTFADEMPLFGWGGAPEHLGGLMIVRQGGQTSVSWGGILFNRKVKVKTATPDGPVVTRFVLPSALHSPTAVPVPGMTPGYLDVEIPDRFGLLYLDGEKTRSDGGTTRRLESQPIAAGRTYPLKVRAVYAVGDRLLIEEKTIAMRAGESTSVAFTGSQAIAMPLPREKTTEATTYLPAGK